MTSAEVTLGDAEAPTRQDARSRERRAALRRLYGAIGLIGALWLFAASRWIVTDTVVPWDSKNQFYAFFRFLAAAIHSGISPFWNPYHYGGHPSVADPQSLIFAPAFVLWSLFDGAPSLRTFDLLVYAHLLVGGIAIGVIGWRARWPVAACALAAAVFMFGGAAAGRLQHTGIILTYALFPPALLLLELALARRSLLIGLLFSLVASALALGRNQTALLLCFVLIAASLANIATADQPLRYLRERAPVIVTMLLAGSALLAAPMLLTLQFAALSNRPELLLDTALQGSLYPADLAQLVVANIFGSQSEFYWGPSAGIVPEVALTDDSFNYVFVGAVPVLLVLWFGIAGGLAFRRGRRLLLGVLVAALLFALGRYTPLFRWSFEWVPGVNFFRRPVDGNFVLLAALALLGGHLLSDFVHAGLPRQRLFPCLAVTVVAAAIAASAVMLSARSGHGVEALVETLKTVAIAGAAILVLALARTGRTRALVAVLVTGIAVAELLWWNVAFRLNADARSYYAVLERPPPDAAPALAVLDRAIEARHAVGERPRVEFLGLGGPWQNLAMVRGLEATNGYNPLRIGDYDRLVAPGEANWRADLREFPASFEGYDGALAQALGLEFVLLGQPIEQVPHLAHRLIGDVLVAGPPVWIYRLRAPAPRLKFTPRVPVVQAEATDAALGTNNARARISKWRPDSVEIEADSQRGGMLVLHDIYYPGWVAEIDGREAPILRADLLFRGLELPPGRHHVVFRFAPFSLENLRHALMMVMRAHAD
jgi:hypothetical protein